MTNEKISNMKFKTPFDLLKVLNELENNVLPQSEFTANQYKDGGINIFLEDKLVASFIDEETFYVGAGLYSCSLQEISLVFNFIYETDHTLWFKGDN